MPSVKVTTNNQRCLNNGKYRDRAIISQEFADKHNLKEKQHVRVENTETSQQNVQTYYRIWDIKNNIENQFQIHEASYSRFNGTPGQKLFFHTKIPFCDTIKQAQKKGGVHEQLEDDGQQDTILIAAPHGGTVEKKTRLIADSCYNYIHKQGIPVSLWKIHGFINSSHSSTAHRVWHFSKVMKSKQSYDKVNEITNRGFSYVAGFHRSGHSTSEIGGLMGEDLRRELADVLRSSTGEEFKTDISDMFNPGTNKWHCENYMSDKDSNTVYLEGSPDLCDDYYQDVGCAVGKFLIDKVRSKDLV